MDPLTPGQLEQLAAIVARKVADRLSAAVLTGPQAAAYCGLSRSAWYKAAAEDSLPRPIALPGTSHPRWRKSQLDAWLAARRAYRRKRKADPTPA